MSNAFYRWVALQACHTYEIQRELEDCKRELKRARTRLSQMVDLVHELERDEDNLDMCAHCKLPCGPIVARCGARVKRARTRWRRLRGASARMKSFARRAPTLPNGIVSKAKLSVCFLVHLSVLGASQFQMTDKVSDRVLVVVSHDLARFAHIVETQSTLTVQDVSTPSTRRVALVGPGAAHKLKTLAKQFPPGYVRTVDEPSVQ